MAVFGSTREQFIKQEISENQELDFLILVDKFPSLDEIIETQAKIRKTFKTIVDLHFIPSNGLRSLDSINELDNFKKLIMFAHRSLIVYSSVELKIPNWLATDYANQANMIGFIQALKLYQSRRTHPQQLLKHYIYLIGGAEVYKVDKQMNFPPDKSGLLERMEQLTLDKSTLEIFKLYKKFKGTLPPKNLVSAINLKIEEHFQTNFQELNSIRKGIIKILSNELPKPLLADLRNY